MDIDNLTISVPHYFDSEDAYGNLYSFAPHTDGQDDGYRKRADYGQWTVDLSPIDSFELNNFLTVFALRNPAEPAAKVKLISGSNMQGALVGSRAAVFAKDKEELTQGQFSCPVVGSIDTLIMNLVPQTTYYFVSHGSYISLSTQNNGGASLQTSAMGVLHITVQCTSASLKPVAPGNLRVIGE
jgi:hypothetical protein